MPAKAASSFFPCMIMFLPIFMAFIDLYKGEDDRRRTAKSMLLLMSEAVTPV